VLIARELIGEERGLDKCLFFVDRDFDDFLNKQPAPHPRTYITDEYSIENCLVCRQSLEVVLMDLAKLSKADPPYKEILSSWDSEYKSSSSAVR
jgi:hypothetical protein